jgi:hypothetical protein
VALVVSVAMTAPSASWNTTGTPGSGAPRFATVTVTGSGPASTALSGTPPSGGLGIELSIATLPPSSVGFIAPPLGSSSQAAKTPIGTRASKA